MKKLQKFVLVFALIAVVLIGATQLGQAATMLRLCRVVCNNGTPNCTAYDGKCWTDCPGQPAYEMYCWEFRDYCNCDNCGCM